MKAVVFSGTTEGRVFSRQLAALGAEVLVSVATPLGAEEQGKADGITVHCGRLTPEEMAAARVVLNKILHNAQSIEAEAKQSTPERSNETC
jgi:precorrin-6x reductase